ncbi:MAG: hypothetical protein DRH33_01130 [Candidatus Nealsonbacteria bacterium]|nr:MAG: hypothetical protein DRH33_01130 [Candidatus Nealsonbacteria bacterium]
MVEFIKKSDESIQVKKEAENCPKLLEKSERVNSDKKSKKSLAIWAILGFILLLIIVGALSGGDEKTRPESTQSQKERQRIFKYVDNPNGLRLRSGPSLSAEILEVLEDKTRVEVLKQQNDWSEVKVGEKQGWVASNYLTTEQQKVTEEKRKKSSIYSINQEVKVGKTIWKLIKTRDRGSILTASESYYWWEDAHSGWYKNLHDKTTNGKFIEVWLDWVNFDEITDEILGDSGLKLKPNRPVVTLIDSKNRKYNPLPDEEILLWAPTETIAEEKLGIPFPLRTFLFFYEIPQNTEGLKIKVRDETTYSNREALIDLGL